MVDPAVKAACIHLLRRGVISAAQAASFACVSEQAVRKWSALQGVNLKLASDRYAAQQFRKLLDARRQPSRAELRREADEAAADMARRLQAPQEEADA